jgi:acetylornithine deacetylase/succinyl-diaminopimelate desuccinylase-like protein
VNRQHAKLMGTVSACRSKRRNPIAGSVTGVCAIVSLLALLSADTAVAQQSAVVSAPQVLVRDVYRQLIGIDTTTDTGDTARAADAMAARLLAAGFAREDVRVFKPAPRKGNLVARLRGSGQRRPMLLVAHLDVVAARREDWSTNPFELTEKDGYFLGRGASDDKFMVASFVANLIRYKQEGYKPARDLVLVLETDEEILDRNGVGMQWLLKQHRPLLEAEFALNEGGTVVGFGPKPAFIGIQVQEKVIANFKLEATDPGGHSSMPRRDTAITKLARAIDKLARFEFPVELNDATRATLEGAAALQPPPVAAGMKAIAAGTADAATIAGISSIPAFNAMLRTTCVATRLMSDGAFNALPVTASATLQCRMLPGNTADQTLATLRQAIGDDQIAVTLEWAQPGSVPSTLTKEFEAALSKVAAQFWPGLPIVPVMSPNATDSSLLRNAGIPSFGFDGLLSDLADFRVHGNDERVSVNAFTEGHEALYLLVKNLSAP